mgnify:CR=1 FL=1
MNPLPDPMAPQAFRDPGVAAALARRIRRLAERTGPAALMEVCGTHTVALFRSGVRALLGDCVTLLSGPGCPVCVTPADIVDRAAAYAKTPGVTVATYGDMMRVPGSRGSLDQARAAGGQVRVVYSPSDALALAAKNPDMRVVFLGVGFETTAPAAAAAVLHARRDGLDNFMVLNAHKLIPPALHALAAMPGLKLDGLICPGHVSAIIGLGPYREVTGKHNLPCVVTGFEPLDLLQGILMLLEQKARGEAAVENQYARAVRPQGNPRARDILFQVFEPVDAVWRGLGAVPGGGMAFREEFDAFDAAARIPLDIGPAPDPPGCRCAAVLVAAVKPPECPLFANRCAPDHPVGPCMVSSEGACAAHYKYGDLS